MARPEITGRHFDRRSKPAELPRVGMSIVDFCRRWDISIATFYNWRKAGVGPHVTQPMGKYGRAYITLESEAEWARKHVEGAESVA